NVYRDGQLWQSSDDHPNGHLDGGHDGARHYGDGHDPGFGLQPDRSADRRGPGQRNSHGQFQHADGDLFGRHSKRHLQQIADQNVYRHGRLRQSSDHDPHGHLDGGYHATGHYRDGHDPGFGMQPDCGADRRGAGERHGHGQLQPADGNLFGWSSKRDVRQITDPN